MSREAHSMIQTWQYSETEVPSFRARRLSISARSSDAVNVIRSVFFPGSERAGGFADKSRFTCISLPPKNMLQPAVNSVNKGPWDMLPVLRLGPTPYFYCCGEGCPIGRVTGAAPAGIPGGRLALATVKSRLGTLPFIALSPLLGTGLRSSNTYQRNIAYGHSRCL